MFFSVVVGALAVKAESFWCIVVALALSRLLQSPFCSINLKPSLKTSWKCELMAGRDGHKTQSPEFFLLRCSCFMKTGKSIYLCISQLYCMMLKSGFTLKQKFGNAESKLEISCRQSAVI